MRPTSTVSRAALRSAALLAALTGVGCGRTATLRVMHPSPLSRWGREIGVGRIENEGDSGIGAIIAQGLASSGAFTVVAEAGERMRVIGRVEQRAMEPERLERRPATCTRTVAETRQRVVPVTVGYPPRTEMQTQTYTEYVQQPYGCTELVRTVGARVRLHVSVNALTRPIREVFSRAFTAHEAESSTGMMGSDDQDHPAPPIDGAAVMRSAEAQSAQQFLDEVLPRDEQVEVEFADCHDRRCDDGLSQVRRGDLAGATQSFSAAVDRWTSERESADQRANLAAATYDRGVVRGYNGELRDGVTDVRRAVSLTPTNSDWRVHLARLESLQAERARTRFRGETRRLGDAPRAR